MPTWQADAMARQYRRTVETRTAAERRPCVEQKARGQGHAAHSVLDRRIDVSPPVPHPVGSSKGGTPSQGSAHPPPQI